MSWVELHENEASRAKRRCLQMLLSTLFMSVKMYLSWRTKHRKFSPLGAKHHFLLLFCPPVRLQFGSIGRDTLSCLRIAVFQSITKRFTSKTG